MTRKTYTDNNGFIRYEDTCKIIPNQPDQKEVLSEMYNIFSNKKVKENTMTYAELDYIEGKCIREMEV